MLFDGYELQSVVVSQLLSDFTQFLLHFSCLNVKSMCLNLKHRVLLDVSDAHQHAFPKTETKHY